MQWIIENWIWLLLGGGFVAMHLFGHGGHGKDKSAAQASAPPPARPDNRSDIDP